MINPSTPNPPSTSANPYAAIVTRSERAAWKVDAILPPDARLDLQKRFLPEALAQVDALADLTPADRTRLNQIRGNSYVHLFNFLEDSVIASVMKHATAAMYGDESQLRALLRFAEEEVKHQELFRRFRACFDRVFPTTCRVVGSAEEVAGFVLGKSPLAVMLVNYHFELITQQHYTESVRNAEEDLEPSFRAILKAHWHEEAQHAAIDALKIEELSRDAAPAWLARSLSDYEEIIVAFDGVLAQQATLDLESLAGARATPLTSAEHEAILTQQIRSYRRVFLLSALRNAPFLAAASRLGADARGRLEMLATRLDGPPRPSDAPAAHDGPPA